MRPKTIMTSSKPDRPLITFALFAYNQEVYIREAVEGALSQTYEPLQIILSDDCSKDQTYQIMEEMVASYDGPHNVRLNRSTKNNGIASHINDVAKISDGEILVLAAGDDISLPERVSLMAKIFTSIPNVFSVYSDYYTIGETAQAGSSAQARQESAFNIVFGGGGIGKGATYAYRRECFFWPRPIPETVLSEDKILPLRAAVLGDVYHLEKQLVAYRKTPDSLGAKLKQGRSVALRRPEHVAALMHELRLAAQQGKIGIARSWFMRCLLAYRRLTIMEITVRPVFLGKAVRVFQRFGRSLMRRLLRILTINRRTFHIE